MRWDVDSWEARRDHLWPSPCQRTTEVLTVWRTGDLCRRGVFLATWGLCQEDTVSTLYVLVMCFPKWDVRSLLSFPSFPCVFTEFSTLYTRDSTQCFYGESSSVWTYPKWTTPTGRLKGCRRFKVTVWPRLIHVSHLSRGTKSDFIQFNVDLVEVDFFLVLRSRTS